jgi:cytochrome b561
LPTPHFTRTAIAFHWLTALIIAGAFPVGLLMGDMAVTPFRIKVFVWHKWAGLTVLWLSCLRLAWRSRHAAPPALAGMPVWQERASRAVQYVVYGLLFAVPLTGWMYSSAAGYSVVYLNLLALPDLVGKDKALADQLKELHETLNWTLLALVGLHAAAALKHHFIDKDTVLLRMLRSHPRSDA